jgi:hypothetical protein
MRSNAGTSTRGSRIWPGASRCLAPPQGRSTADFRPRWLFQSHRQVNRPSDGRRLIAERLWLQTSSFVIYENV